jgi:hypothetical protein
MGGRWRYVGERVGRVFEDVIFVEAYDRNSSAMVIPACLGWSTKE